MLTPFRCSPIYKERPWGGRWFSEKLGRNLPGHCAEALIGESWELSCRYDHPANMSRIIGGEWDGKPFDELILQHPEELLGRRLVEQNYPSGEALPRHFPLLIKFLDAADRLSIQVHPDDSYAAKQNPGESGKSEMWYVLDAEPDAELIVGVKSGVTREEFAASLADRSFLRYLNSVPVKPGDAFYIPAGTVHAISKGIRLAEIQQNSDTTYRLYDWDRKDKDGKLRDLHIDDALAVLNFSGGGVRAHSGITLRKRGVKRRIVTAVEYFAVEELEIEELAEEIYPERFEVWMILEGSGVLQTETGPFPLQIGETWLIPAQLGNYLLEGKLKVLKTYIPDLLTEIIKPLQKLGYTRADLQESIGGLAYSTDFLNYGWERNADDEKKLGSAHSSRPNNFGELGS